MQVESVTTAPPMLLATAATASPADMVADPAGHSDTGLVMDVKPEPVDDAAAAAAAAAAASAAAVPATASGIPNPSFPPPKTDKPRPHVCQTCTRSFARLEHLKRHERSHTKEKPFECPECSRRFARRDLLLRHQQKLHMTNTTAGSSGSGGRARGSRRESTSSVTGAATSVRARRSVASGAPATSGGASAAGGATAMRPRANTISHVEGSSLNMTTSAPAAATAPSIARHAPAGPRHSHHASLSHLPGPHVFEPHMALPSASPHSLMQGLPRLETQGLPPSDDMEGGLRTAPPYAAFPFDHGMQGFFSAGPGSTVNPAHLHISDSPPSYSAGTPTSPFHTGFPDVSSSQAIMNDDDSSTARWASAYDDGIPFFDPSEVAVAAESSPSTLSTTSRDVMFDGSNLSAATAQQQWHNHAPPTPSTSHPPSHLYAMDISSVASTSSSTGTISDSSASTAYGEIISPAPLTGPGKPSETHPSYTLFSREYPSTCGNLLATGPFRGDDLKLSSMYSADPF